MVAAERERNVDNLTPILNLLSHTPFECLGAEQLTGGALNFTFRGRLASPLSDGSQSIIIKYSKDYVLRGTVDTTIPASRCGNEYQILEGLSSHIPPAYHDRFIIKPPRPYQIFPQDGVQVIQDFQNTTPLLGLLLHPVESDLSPPFAASVGHAIGIWLRSFHSQPSKHGNSRCLSSLSSIEKDFDGRDKLRNYYYDILEQKIRMFPHLFDGIANKIKEYAAEEIERKNNQPGMGLVHGDFSLRNLLISETTSRSGENILLSPIDWEFSHHGRRDQDLCHITSELYILQELKGIKSCEVFLQGLIAGYGESQGSSVYNIAVYFGIHILSWVSIITPETTKEQEEGLVRFARDLIIKGREKNRGWLEGTVMRYFFSERQ